MCCAIFKLNLINYIPYVLLNNDGSMYSHYSDSKILNSYRNNPLSFILSLFLMYRPQYLLMNFMTFKILGVPKKSPQVFLQGTLRFPYAFFVCYERTSFLFKSTWSHLSGTSWNPKMAKTINIAHFSGFVFILNIFRRDK